MMIKSPDYPFYIPYRKGKLWGYCTPEKEMIIPCQYHWAGVFRGDAAVVGMNGKFGAINRSGKLFMPYIYNSAEKAKYELYDKEDPMIWDPEIDEVISSMDLWPPYKLNELTEYLDLMAEKKAEDVGEGYIDEEDMEDDDFEEEDTDEYYEKGGYVFYNGLSVFRKGDKFGYINDDFEVVIPCIYDNVVIFYKDFTWVNKKGKWGTIDTKGKELIPCIYDDWDPDDDDVYAVVLWKGYWSFIKMEGHVKYWED